MLRNYLKTLVVVAIAGFTVQSAYAKRNSLKGGLGLISGVDEYKLLVKFRSNLNPDLSSASRALSLGGKYLSYEIQSLVDTYDISFTREIQYSDEELEVMRGLKNRQYMDRKGFNKYEMSGLMRINVPNPTGSKLLEIGNRFEQFSEVEYASLEAVHPAPPPIDYSPQTPDLTDRQTYRGPNPGIDVDYAWSLGLRGAGLAVADLEHSWGRLDHANQNVHEDLHNQDISYGLPWRTDDYEDHGTAVMGLLMAAENNYGVNGSVPEIRGHVYSVLHGDATILQAAINNSQRGDIILMEMQRGNGGGAPPEVVATLWDLIEQGSRAGVVIVETAGNGGEDLDASNYSSYRARGDAGAIVLGAGSPNTSHDRLSFSTYGQCCVHVQGWGSGVFTTGYGAFQAYGGDPNQEYTAGFSGTSSAGPIVTSAVTLVQSYAKDFLDTLLTGVEIRDLLVATGIPQGSGGHIGPLPDVRAAIEQLQQTITPLRIRKPWKLVTLTSTKHNLHFSFPYENEHVKITLYDALGSQLKVLVDEPREAGHYSLDLNEGERLAEGVYFVTMEVADGKKSLRLAVF